jgi:hypothetical protein
MRHLLISLLGLLTACSGGALSVADGPAPADLADAYPPGPYGDVIGDTVAPLQWIGYVDPRADVIATSEPYGDYSMDALRRSGAPYALVHVSEYF